MKHSVMTAVLVVGLVMARGTLAADRGPSTPEERTRAVNLVQSLESDPFGVDAQAARRWLTQWAIEVPDISVKVCADLLGPALGEKYPYSGEVGLHPLFAATRFAIEHPDQASDDVAMYTAGTEGALRVYEVILKTKPDAQLSYLDDLLGRRERGELAEYVARVAKKQCKS
jgi:hypothetical protein